MFLDYSIKFKIYINMYNLCSFDDKTAEAIMDLNSLMLVKTKQLWINPDSDMKTGLFLQKRYGLDQMPTA